MQTSRRALSLSLLAIAAMSAVLCACGSGGGTAAVVIIKDHRFSPDAITVSAGRRFAIQVINRDPSPEEFESYDFRIEKIVVGGGKVLVNVGPLKPGRYAFFGDYNPTLAKGVLTVVP